MQILGYHLKMSASGETPDDIQFTVDLKEMYELEPNV